MRAAEHHRSGALAPAGVEMAVDLGQRRGEACQGRARQVDVPRLGSGQVDDVGELTPAQPQRNRDGPVPEIQPSADPRAGQPDRRDPAWLGWQRASQQGRDHLGPDRARGHPLPPGQINDRAPGERVPQCLFRRVQRPGIHTPHIAQKDTAASTHGGYRRSAGSAPGPRSAAGTDGQTGSTTTNYAMPMHTIFVFYSFSFAAARLYYYSRANGKV